MPEPQVASCSCGLILPQHLLFFFFALPRRALRGWRGEGTKLPRCCHQNNSAEQPLGAALASPRQRESHQRVSLSVWGRSCICSQSAADSRETLQMQLAREMNYLFDCTSLVQARTILAEGRARSKCCSGDCLPLNCIRLFLFNDPYLSPSDSGRRREDLELFPPLPSYQPQKLQPPKLLFLPNPR